MGLVQVTVPEATRAAVIDVLEREGIDYVLTEATEDPAYADLSVVETTVDFQRKLIDLDPDVTDVVVTVTRPSDGRYPALADRIERRIEAGTDEHVRVQVRFLEVDAAG